MKYVLISLTKFPSEYGYSPVENKKVKKDTHYTF